MGDCISTSLIIVLIVYKLLTSKNRWPSPRPYDSLCLIVSSFRFPPELSYSLPPCPLFTHRRPRTCQRMCGLRNSFYSRLSFYLNIIRPSVRVRVFLSTVCFRYSLVHDSGSSSLRIEMRWSMKWDEKACRMLLVRDLTVQLNSYCKGIF